MSKRGRMPRLRRAVVVIVAGVTFVPAVSASACVTLDLLLCEGDAAPGRRVPDWSEAGLRGAIDRFRSGHALAALVRDRDLDRMAEMQARSMATRGAVFHGTAALVAEHQQTGDDLAENVGAGGSVRDVHAGFLRSPRHRRNLLADMDRFGVGIARTRAGEVFVAEIFARHGSEPRSTEVIAQDPPRAPDRYQGRPVLVDRDSLAAAPPIGSSSNPPLPLYAFGLLAPLSLMRLRTRRRRRSHEA